MLSLQRLLEFVSVTELKSVSGKEKLVKGISCDSRTVEEGFVFVALKGEVVDGHRFVKDAVANGCIAVIVEDEVDVPENIPVIRVADSHRAYGLAAAEFFGHPSHEMKVVGITGTNGKTTTSWILEQVIKASGGRPGVIGTVNYHYEDQAGKTVAAEAPLTTPEPMLLQRMLREMCDAGVTHAILEVSSHSLSQQRLAGMLFDVAVFTNLSRDHLDYHLNMAAYFEAKQKLFNEYLQPGGTAIVAVDPAAEKNKKQNDWGAVLTRKLRQKGFKTYPAKGNGQSIMTYGFDRNCSVQADQVSQHIDGVDFTSIHNKKKKKVCSQLIGRHNVSNMLAAIAAGTALQFDTNDILNGLQKVQAIPGRLERVLLPSLSREGEGPRVFVDYAHTPDALENVLKTLRPVTTGRLFCVFGCGGDRDRGKRPLMGAVAARIADGILVTSDNPRGEEPGKIMAGIEEGCTSSGLKRVAALDDFFALKKSAKAYVMLEDRRQAIYHACSRAESGDVVLIAGKGHENYQITVKGKSFFDDRIEARNGSMCWSVGHLLKATGGELVQQGKETLLGNVSTDTRTLKKGSVFVALKGENFDGHNFLGGAIEKGASAVVVENTDSRISKKVSIVQVDDTLRALGELASYRRCMLGRDVTIIGITGSSGKTTVKEMTASIFQESFAGNPCEPVLKTKGNLNNLIGLPLSLLNINAGHRVAVLEMGMNRPGEIERLAQIADPDIGCITNVQAAHLEGLGSIEGVAMAKGELFASMSGQGVRIINLDDPHIRRLGGDYGNNVISFAITPVGRRFNPVVRATRIVSLGEGGMRFTLHINQWRERFTIPAAGMHNVANCAAAAAIATAAGVAPKIIVRGLARYTSGDKRLQVTDIGDGIHVVNDSYNANPASMAAALKTVRGFGRKCRRVALLGDMFELGASAPEAHAGVGKLVGELGFEYLGVTGDYAKTLAKMARQSGMKSSQIRVCRDKKEMADWITGLVAGKKIKKNDWILLKGSRGMQMEKVLQEMEQKMNKDKK